MFRLLLIPGISRPRSCVPLWEQLRADAPRSFPAAKYSQAPAAVPSKAPAYAPATWALPGDLHQASWREINHRALHFVRRHLLAAGKRVLAVTPGTTQIAGGQPDEGAGNPGKRRFALNGPIDLSNQHG